MIKQNLIIYSNPILYEILKEIENEIEYSVNKISSDKQINYEELSENLVLTNVKSSKILNSIELEFPIKIAKLIERINIKFIKLKTKEKASVSLGKYEIRIKLYKNFYINKQIEVIKESN